MKILQVIPYFVPAYSYGGPVKVCFDISKELVKRGHDVTVVTTDALDDKHRIIKLKENISGVEVARFKNVSNWLAKNCNGYLPIGFFFWIKKNIRNYDAVHCHDFFTLQNIIISHFCKKYSIPFVIQPHGTLSPVRQEAKFKTLKKLFTKLFTGILYNAKNIIALTENEKSEILLINKQLGDKIKVIPNGLKLEEFQNIGKIDLYKKYNIPKENKIIGYIGRIQYIKGIDITLEILSLLKKKLDFTYIIIGPDEQNEKAKLEKQAKKIKIDKNIIFTGILTGKKKLEIMKSCDIFIFTSRAEGTPITAIEVAALGIPQVISKNCPISKIIHNGKSGFRYSLNEKQKIANKIFELLTNQSLWEKTSHNAKQLVNKKLNLETVVRSFQNLYLELLDKK